MDIDVHKQRAFDHFLVSKGLIYHYAFLMTASKMTASKPHEKTNQMSVGKANT